MRRIAALFVLFKAGHVIADPAKWKNRQITANAIGAVLVALVQLAESFGYYIPVDADTATVIAAGVLAVVNVVLTVVTTDKVGLSPDGDDTPLPPAGPPPEDLGPDPRA